MNFLAAQDPDPAPDPNTFNSPSVPDGTQIGIVRSAVVTDQMSPRDIAKKNQSKTLEYLPFTCIK